MKMLSDKDVAELCHVKKTTIRTWAKKGKFPPPLRIGKKLLWPSDLVDEWLKKKLEETNK